MGNLFTSLLNSANAVRVLDRQLAVLQNNVTNANTPGFRPPDTICASHGIRPLQRAAGRRCGRAGAQFQVGICRRGGPAAGEPPRLCGPESERSCRPRTPVRPFGRHGYRLIPERSVPKLLEAIHQPERQHRAPECHRLRAGCRRVFLAGLYRLGRRIRPCRAADHEHRKVY